MILGDRAVSNLRVQETLVVGKQLVVPKIQAEELVVTSGNSAQFKAAVIDDLTIVNKILLPTVGGTASPLTFYQELAGTVEIKSASFGANQTVAMHIARIGKVVTMTLEGFVTAGSGFGATFFAFEAIPTQFRPVLTYEIPIEVVDNGVPCVGFFNLSTAGSITMYRGVVAVNVLGQNTFSGTGDTGFTTLTASWIAA